MPSLRSNTWIAMFFSSLLLLAGLPDTLPLSAEERPVHPSGRLQPWSENPWYWSYAGQPVLLLGGSDDDNLFQWPTEKLIPQLDRIRAAGGNYVRNTMSDRQDGGFEVYPFKQLDNGKYDLTQWNPTYWSRFERFLKETAARQIFVQIEVWDRFDYTDNRANDPQRWTRHPYNPPNNVNYTAAETGLENRYPEHPGANRQPFFYSTPKQRHIEPLLKIQQAFVRKLLQHALAYDHVVYCIDNETRAEPAWGEYWASFIRQEAAAQEKQVEVTEMWDDWDLKSERHRQTFDHPDRYSFVDVSQNNHNSGQLHWDNLQFVRQLLASQPRPINTTKTYGADGNKFGHSDQDAVERFWRHLLGGVASARFHRPDSGLGINDRAVACLRSARAIEAHVPYWNLSPAQELLGDCNRNEAYAAATADRATVVIFFPRPGDGHSRSVQLQVADASWQARWVDIDRGQRGEVTNIANALVEPPDAYENCAVILRRMDQGMFGGEVLELGEHTAFVLLPEPKLRSSDEQPWVLYAPTLWPNYPDEHERWLHAQLLAAGIAVAGIDVGEAYGSPACNAAQSKLYDYLTSERGFAKQPCLLGRSRGGLWQSSWAAENPHKVAGLAGIYPVFDLRSYPGLKRATGAYGLSLEELEGQLPQLNPISKAKQLVEQSIPVYIIHGNQDQVVPIEENSAALHAMYASQQRDDRITIEVVAGQGHNYWPGFFRCQGLVDFVIRQARNGN